MFHRSGFTTTAIAAAAVLASLALPTRAAAQTGRALVEGFAGFTLRGTSTAPVFGGNVAVPVASSVQVFVEGGRMSDLMSSTIATALDFAPVDVKLPGIYGEGGVRVIAPRGRPARPYADAAFGIISMRPSFAGVNGQTDAIVNAALQFLRRNEPMLELGAGVLLQGGPVFLDLGYRFTKIQTNNIEAALAGTNFTVNQFRVGVGVSF